MQRQDIADAKARLDAERDAAVEKMSSHTFRQITAQQSDARKQLQADCAATGGHLYHLRYSKAGDVYTARRICRDCGHDAAEGAERIASNLARG